MVQRGQRTFVGTSIWRGALLLVAGALLLPGTAHAGDGDIVTAPRGAAFGSGCAPCYGGGSTCVDVCSPCGSSGHAGHAHRGSGTSWGVLRRHLTGKERIRARYLNYYFLRRHPFRQGRTRRFSRIRTGQISEQRAGINRHGVVRVDDVVRTTSPAGINRHGIVYVHAVEKREEGAAIDPIDYLNRGMAHFYWGMYKEAGQDFDAALAGEELAPARIGRMLCAIIKSDWNRAASEMNRLVAAGELRADDRLLVAETFRKSVAFPSIIEGLEGVTRYGGGGAPHLVAAWALTTTGRGSEAASYLERARDKFGSSPAFLALERLHQPAAAPKPAPTKVTPAPERVTPEPMLPVRPTLPGMQPPPSFSPPLADRTAG